MDVDREDVEEEEAVEKLFEPITEDEGGFHTGADVDDDVADLSTRLDCPNESGMQDNVSEDGEAEEGRKPWKAQMPHRVSKEEREEHELTHCPFRIWCRFCVEGRSHKMMRLTSAFAIYTQNLPSRKYINRNKLHP